MLALVGFFLWWAVVLTYVTHRNRQQSARIKNLENEQKRYMKELTQIKEKLYGKIEGQKTKEAKG